jgi:putative DNA primase/helicase
VIVDAAKAVRIEHEVARRGGLNLKRHGAELVGGCPRCGGVDRFAVSITKQVFNCRGCGTSGDVIAMVQHIDGCDFKTAVRTLDGYQSEMGSPKSETPIVDPRPIEPVNRAEIDGQNSKWALKIWNDATPIAGTPAEIYLHRRGLHDLPGDGVLRFHPFCAYGKARVLCLIALYRDIATNEPKAISRTALDAAGNKIGRMSLGPVGSAAIKVDDDTNVEYGLAIGEGLETVLAARQLGFRPAWALGSAGAIRNFEVLPGITALTIITDNDQPDARGRQAGQEVALACSAWWTAAGVEVIRIVPRAIGADMADIIIEQEGSRQATA